MERENKLHVTSNAITSIVLWILLLVSNASLNFSTNFLSQSFLPEARNTIANIELFATTNCILTPPLFPLSGISNEIPATN